MSIITKNITNYKIHAWQTWKRCKELNLNFKFDEIIDINIHTLKLISPNNSKIKIDFICDQCHKQFNKLLRNISMNEINNDYIICKYCKREQTLLEHYNVINPSQNPLIQLKIQNTKANKTEEEKIKIQNKIVQTNLQRYGCINPSHNDQIKNKISQAHLNKTIDEKQQIIDKRKQTNLEKYGVESVSQIPAIQEKRKQTFLKRFGVNNPQKSKTIQEKTKKTNLLRYNAEYTLQNPEIRAKGKLSMYKNNNIPTSKQQNYFYNILKDNELNKENIKLNYPLHHIALDIALLNEKINIEYNGGGHDLDVKLRGSTHEQFLQKEIRRNKFIRQQGWKQIFIISPNDKINNYTDNEYIRIIYIAKQYLLNTNHHWVNIYIEENKFETNIYTQSITNILNIIK